MFRRDNPENDLITTVVGILAEYEREQVEATRDVNILGRLFSFNKNMKAEGLARATAYRQTLKPFLVVPDNVVPDKVAQYEKMLEIKLAVKLFNDLTSPMGTGPLETSLDLRSRLTDALCRHLGGDVKAMNDDINTRTSNYIASMRGSHQKSRVYQLRLEQATKHLKHALIKKGYIDSEIGKEEMDDVPLSNMKSSK